jgi:hypothetical protein
LTGYDIRRILSESREREQKPKEVAVSPKDLTGGHELRLKWTSGEDLDPIFSDHLHVARAGQFYYLTFGQTRVPIAVEKRPEQLEIRPMVRLVVHEAAMENFMRLLSGMVEKEPQHG